MRVQMRPAHAWCCPLACMLQTLIKADDFSWPTTKQRSNILSSETCLLRCGNAFAAAEKTNGNLFLEMHTMQLHISMPKGPVSCECVHLCSAASQVMQRSFASPCTQHDASCRQHALEVRRTDIFGTRCHGGERTQQASSPQDWNICIPCRYEVGMLMSAGKAMDCMIR